MTQTPLQTGYQRALDAEPELYAIVRIVDALCALTRPTDRMCTTCVWETIIKPLVSPLIGWGRGFQPNQASDGPPEITIVTATELLEEYERDLANRVPALTDTEKWMRTSDAFDAFTDKLLHRLAAADPGNGHGVAQAATP